MPLASKRPRSFKTMSPLGRVGPPKSNRPARDDQTARDLPQAQDERSSCQGAESSYLTLPHEDQAELEWKSLYARVQDCPSYRKYRQRQGRSESAGDDKVWSEQLEQAFFQALVQYPPMGRGKQLYRDKQHGRNELIAYRIEALTGELRSRKQISSHIQVLKSFFGRDTDIMKHFSTKDCRPGAIKSGSSSPSDNTGCKSSNYHSTHSPQLQCATPYAIPRNRHHGVDKLEGHLDVLQPTNFRMFLRRKQPGPNEPQDFQPLHTFTESIARPLQSDITMIDWPDLSEAYPLLSNMHACERLDCNVVVAHASLAFPLHGKDVNNHGCNTTEVEISVKCATTLLLEHDSGVKCCTSIYRNGTVFNALGHENESYHVFGPSDRVDVHETEVSFGSTFWTKILAMLDQRLREPQEASFQEHSEEVDAILREITVVQEFYTPIGTDMKRILVTHWTFSMSSDEKGCASWRKLLLPSASDYYPDIERDGSPSSMSTDTFGNGMTYDNPGYVNVYQPFEYDHVSSSEFSIVNWSTSVSDDGFSDHQAEDHLMVNAQYGFVSGTGYPMYDPRVQTGDIVSASLDSVPPMQVFVADQPLPGFRPRWYNDYVDKINERDLQLYDLPMQTNYGTPIYDIMDETLGYFSYDDDFHQQAHAGVSQSNVKRSLAIRPLFV